MIIRYFASRQKDKNIIGAELIFGRFGLPYLRQAGVFYTNKQRK
jgi:hypothetical protein